MAIMKRKVNNEFKIESEFQLLYLILFKDLFIPEIILHCVCDSVCVCVCVHAHVRGCVGVCICAYVYAYSSRRLPGRI